MKKERVVVAADWFTWIITLVICEAVMLPSIASLTVFPLSSVACMKVWLGIKVGVDVGVGNAVGLEIGFAVGDAVGLEFGFAVGPAVGVGVDWS